MSRIRGTVVLSIVPDAQQEHQIATAVAQVAEAELTSWEILDRLPSGLDVATEDQLSATLRDNPRGCVLVVWMEDNDELDNDS